MCVCVRFGRMPPRRSCSVALCARRPALSSHARARLPAVDVDELVQPEQRGQHERDSARQCTLCRSVQHVSATVCAAMHNSNAPPHAGTWRPRPAWPANVSTLALVSTQMHLPHARTSSVRPRGSLRRGICFSPRYTLLCTTRLTIGTMARPVRSAMSETNTTARLTALGGGGTGCPVDSLYFCAARRGVSAAGCVSPRRRRTRLAHEGCEQLQVAAALVLEHLAVPAASRVSRCATARACSAAARLKSSSVG